MNDKNLIPNNERSPNELREMGRKGGIASGESRRRKKRLREDVQLLADVLYQSEEGKRFLESIRKGLS